MTSNNWYSNLSMSRLEQREIYHANKVDICKTCKTIIDDNNNNNLEKENEILPNDKHYLVQ